MLCHEHLDAAMQEDYKGSRYRAFNYQICQAVDLLCTGIILERMEKLGLDPNEKKAIETAVSATNALFRQANDRLHGQSLSNVL